MTSYKKSRLVLSVIKKLVNDEVKLNHNLGFDSFCQKYAKLQSKTVHGTYLLFNEKQRIQDAKKGIGGKKVYFVDEAIKLPSGEEILVCNQWGIGNIGRFLKVAKEYGCFIAEIK